MTREEVRNAFAALRESMEADNDPYFMVHFSREEDAYAGEHSGLDGGDALIIISQLAKRFNLDPGVMAVSASTEAFVGDISQEARHSAHLLSNMKVLIDLLERADQWFAECERAPDERWYKQWLQIRYPGAHFILTDYGWESGEALASYRADDPDFQPHDEIGAPSSDDNEVQDGQ